MAGSTISAEASARGGGEVVDADAGIQIIQTRTTTQSSRTITNNTDDKAPPPQPSYYIDSFHEHFFPHTDAETPNGSTTAAAALPRKKKLSLIQRYATSQARHPWKHGITAFVIAVILSFVGLRFGNFEVAIDNAGWWSRGTQISDRATQEIIVSRNRKELFQDETGEFWKELETVVQPNWQRSRAEEAEEASGEKEVVAQEELKKVCSGEWYGSWDMVSENERNLNVIWKTDDAEKSMLDGEAMYDLCKAEESTLAQLEASDSCYKCTSEVGGLFDDGGSGQGKCIEPYSLVLMARLHLVNNNISEINTLSQSISCDKLRSSWTPTVQHQFTIALKSCVNWAVYMSSGNNDNSITIQNTTITVTDPCPFPFGFQPVVVDDLFPTANPPVVRYSSSYFATKKGKAEVQTMYEDSEAELYDRSDGNPMEGVYETTAEDFQEMYSDAIVGRDMSLAVGSAGVTVIAMLLHTKSPFLTLMGLFQILLSFPLAYFVYYFMGGLVFFPFLNFIGIFVVFALGADDVFVAVDKWKNARQELPHGTTEQVAALALPDAAYAMLLTSLTTAVAFFGTAICPVGPIVCFAVFCGLLITFDYMMNIFLVFPALCLYDKWLQEGSKNCCINFDWCCGKKHAEEQLAAEETDARGSTNNEGEVEESSSNRPGGVKRQDTQAERDDLIEVSHQSFIHRILDGYYNFLHKFRWLVLAASTAALITCAVLAAGLTLPTSSDVALLPDSNQYQMHYAWGENLLSKVMAKEAGSEALITWGTTPADTGDHLNPDSWTTLVLDDTFDPKSQESQEYLLGFCDRLFADFGKVSDDYECPINQFNAWLNDQSTSETPTEAYTQKCNGASAVPVPSDVFDPCMIAWSKLTNSRSVLSKQGSIKIMDIRTKSKVVYDSPFDELEAEWDLYEAWMENERSVAPNGVNKMFNSDFAYWWYDTNLKMLRTAYGAAAIALVCAAVIVFVSSRSFVLTFFAAISIAYVLVATTACLVALGWELGFLESILFAILIGISCDFVIHTGHAYTMYSGSVSRKHRSHFALTHMGPSILAAAFTTFMAAVVMIFTEITFFYKFAVMLFMTILHSVVGCFVIYLVLCDCFGPAEPTKGYDTIKAKLCGDKDQAGSNN